MRLAFSMVAATVVAAPMLAHGGEPGSYADARPIVARESLGDAAVTLGSYDQLSPGNRLIAQALYHAQKVVPADGPQQWTVERLAGARAGGANWGDVFRQMKLEGLVEAQTLGLVVTWYQYQQAAASGFNSASSVAGVAPVSTKSGQ